MSVTLLAPPHRAHEVYDLIERLENGEIFRDRDFVHIAKDGTKKRVSLSATKIRSFIGEGAHYAAIVSDETETIKAAAEMKDLNRELDQRIGELSQANQELPIARDQALEASSLKSAFVANISHAIRTPLSGILGMSELILEKPLDNDTQETVATVHDSAVALLSIVNDILDLSRLEDGLAQLESKMFNPIDLITDCIKLVTPGAASKGIYLTISVDPRFPQQVYGDHSRVRQILLNLIGNAIKFTGSGRIGVDASLVSEDEKSCTVELSVTDTGIGIAPEDGHLLFTPFSRIEKSTRGIQGSGLGLAISKRFADLMRGKIQFESEKGKGSRFWFTVPFDKAMSGEQLPVSIRTAPSSDWLELFAGCRVLSVEDNPVLSALIMRQLTNIGIAADFAMSGKEALEKVRSTKFDIVFMDINLPDINGYEITENIRAIEASLHGHRHIVIAMTAGAMSGDRERALSPAWMIIWLSRSNWPSCEKRSKSGCKFLAEEWK